MKTIALSTSRMIALPKRLFKPSEKVALFIEGNMVIIKKLESPQLSSIAARVKERPLPMREIVQEVQAYRRAKRAA